MSIRNLFDGTNPTEVFAETPENIREDGESVANVKETWENRKRFIPQVDFSKPETFARYGSAEKYYNDAIKRIYEDYPYDGSAREKQQFLQESTYMDLWLLDNKYPRTNGFITISAEGWGSLSTAPNAATAYYGNPTTKEYINFLGGPHTASEGMIGKKLSETFDDSNKYDTDIYGDKGFTGTGTRESNLKTNFDNGVTVEFWLKKDAFVPSLTKKEVIFDLWNGADTGNASYGRILLQLTGTLNNNFLLTIQSGTSSPYEEEAFGSETTLTTLQTFSHYAFRMYNSGSDLNVDFYKNSQLLESKSAVGLSLEEITGSLQANIGALTSPARLGPSHYADKGWGKLSGSLDEFRFWKAKRTSKDIGRYWFTQVGGGSNEDVANASLGVYYKFNEGISGVPSIDSTVLDYSGRVTNGAWTGYNTSARSTESAMVLAGATQAEFKDPIIYPENPLVSQVSSELKASGSYHDYNNIASLYGNFPEWIIQGDENESGYLKQLTQIMSSYLDTLYLQVEQLSTIKNINYVSSSNKPLPFARELVNSTGLVANNMFTSADILNQIFTRDETKNFEDEIYDVKNMIYKNIYNNIVDIYKSKGTEKAFRNLIRCYGVDDNLVRINAYANNIVFDLNEEYRFSTSKKRFVDFYRPDSFYASIYQQTASGNPNSTSFISASQGNLEDYTSFTAETEIIFPKKKLISQTGYYPTPFVTSSIFGFHTADSSTPTDFTWPASDYDIQVYAVKPNTNGNNSAGYLLVTSSYYGLDLQSDLIEDLYDNRKWNISLRVKPTKVQADLVSGSATTNYTLELYAINSILDTIQSEVSLSAQIISDGEKLLNEPKRIYAGAHRQNFTGSSLHGSDIRLGSLRYWTTYLPNEVIKSHGRNTENFGSLNPYRNSYNFVTSLTGTEIPEIETLALYWEFAQITGSDNGSGVSTVPDAGFNVLDYSSGSSEISQRYSWMGNVVGKQHTGRADFMYPNDTAIINVDFIPIGKQTEPEIVNAYDTVKVFNIEDEQLFTRQSRPTNFYYMVEKSMYASITQEIINYFASILDFNNLIGDPVNRYRQEYKSLGKLRSLFFENVGNTPNVERYIEYYKWIDDSLGQMLMELFPASSVKQDGIRTTIESHVLERNKYRNKYPTVDVKQDDPETGIDGINRLTYNWKEGHHPVDGLETEACFWWKNRAERNEPPLATGLPGLDAARQQILSVTLSALNRQYSNPLKYTVKKEQIVTSGVAIENNKRELVRKSVKFGDSSGIIAKTANIQEFEACNDDLDLNLKRKFAFKAESELDSDPYLDGKGDLLLPFVPVSSSVVTGYQSLVNTGLKDGFGIENLHVDSYIDSEVPMQGPFTQKFVGGNQHRHIKLNDGTDTALNRPEAWQLEFQGAPKAIKFVHQPVNHPRAMLYRDLVAKRSVNIKNIKTDTGSYGLGNYTEDYEIVQTVSRTQNNVAFVKAGGFTIEYIPSPYIAGMDDYAKPQRGKSPWVFVNRFSSPGAPDTAGDSNGGPALDPEAAEFSPYNDLNYRNTTVRDPYRLLLASHVNQFGYYSDVFDIGAGPSTVNSLNYAGTASIYQVNRNPIRQMKDSGSTTITASIYDNYFVQHAIPRSDLQYAWITSSYMSYDTFGYLPYDGDGDLITFSSASEFRSRNRFRPTTSDFKDRKFGRDETIMGGPFAASNFYFTYVPTTYNWLNLNTREPLEYTNSFIGFTEDDTDVESYLNDSLITDGVNTDGKPSLLNSLLLKRNGPYQHPTWKQTRGYENPLVKKWNSSNLTAYNLENDDLKIRQDPPIISKYKALTQILNISTEQKSITALENVFINSTFGNETALFANRSINRDLNISNDTFKLAYDDIRTLYVDGALNIISNPIQGLGYLAYKEQVYPSAINMYSFRNRERVNYKNTFWKNSREARSILGKDKFGGTNSQGYVVSQSAWALDTSEQFGTGLSTYIAESASIGKAGELQNDYTFAYRLAGSTHGDSGSIRPSPILNRKHMLGSKYSVMNPFTIQNWFIRGLIPVSRTTLSGTFLGYLDSDEADGVWPGISEYNTLGHVSIFGGNAKFEAHEQAGFFEGGQFISSPSNPFYDKYDLYVQNMRLKNKDMTLIPEFRISNFIKDYLQNSDGFISTNTASFSIFGINQQNAETVTYLKDDGLSEAYEIQISEATPENSGEGEFYRIYSFSDFMESFDIISDDHDKYTSESFSKAISLSCKALKKFIAYDGFYPAERTLEMSEYLKEDYQDLLVATSSAKQVPVIGEIVTEPTEDLKLRPFYTTLISPGILFNTIKSGIAVDYPIYTGSYEVVRYYNNSGTLPHAPADKDYSDYYAIGTASSNTNSWHYRVPFEAILNPDLMIGRNLMDMEPHPSASLGLLTKLDAKTSQAQSKYKKAMNNFLSETVNFFLQDSSLTSLESKQEDEFISTDIVAGDTYGLRVKIRKSMMGEKASTVNYPVPQEYYSNESVLSGLSVRGVSNKLRLSTINMYSRPTAFGPPLAGTGSFNGFIDGPVVETVGFGPTAFKQFTDSLVYDGLFGYNVSHTPPYYNGEAWVDVLYTAETSGQISLDTIFASASVISWRIDGLTNDIWPSGDDAAYPMHRNNVNNYAMQITSSVNLFNKKFNKSVADSSQNKPVWSIQTKFETPILNFSPYAKDGFDTDLIDEEYLENVATPSNSGSPWEGYDGKTTTPLGIWHQFGLIPKASEGIYLEIDDIEPEWLNNRVPGTDIDSTYNGGDVKSLKDIVGFTAQSEKIGKLAESKTIFEAVVAIPFVDVKNISRTPSLVTNPNQTARNFFKLPVSVDYVTNLNKLMSSDLSQDNFGLTESIMQPNVKSLFPLGTDQSIIEMAEKIKDRYVFPPQFDFFRNQNARPIAMYIFDFEHTFDKNDLSYMWQNIAPKIGNEFQEASATISHPLLTKNNLLEDLKDKVKWMVFKVKQRAKTKYNNLLVGGNQKEDLFSYNWPYDYFSLIEFAKIDSSITYGSIEEATIGTTDSNAGILPPFGPADLSQGNSTSTTASKSVQNQAAALVKANVDTSKREK